MSEIRTVPELLIQRAEKNPDRTFLFFRDEKITVGGLYKKSASVAAALKEFGVKKDDKVALMLPNAPEFLYAWFGCALAGAMMVPLNTALKGEGLKYIVSHSDAKVFIFDEQYFPQISPQVSELKNITRWVASSGITSVEPDIKECALPRNTVSFEKILSSLPPVPSHR